MKLEWVSKNLLKIYFKTFFFSFLTAQQSGSFLQKEYIYVFMKFDWNTYFHIMYYQNLMKFDWLSKTLWWIFFFQINLWKRILRQISFLTAQQSDCDSLACHQIWENMMNCRCFSPSNLPWIILPCSFGLNAPITHWTNVKYCVHKKTQNYSKWNSYSKLQ